MKKLCTNCKRLRDETLGGVCLRCLGKLSKKVDHRGRKSEVNRYWFSRTRKADRK
jgi:hypothetical protein